MLKLSNIDRFLPCYTQPEGLLSFHHFCCVCITVLNVNAKRWYFSSELALIM